MSLHGCAMNATQVTVLLATKRDRAPEKEPPSGDTEHDSTPSCGRLLPGHLQQADDVLDTPHAIGETCLHGRRGAKRAVDADEIVVSVAGRCGPPRGFSAWLRLQRGCGKIVVSRLARRPLRGGSPGRSDPPESALSSVG